MNKRGIRKRKEGVVVSDKMNKTITVSIERLELHPRYKKYVRKTTKYKAHDPQNEAKTGDRVEIVETRPLSKTKNWRLAKILDKKGV